MQPSHTPEVLRTKGLLLGVYSHARFFSFLWFPTMLKLLRATYVPADENTSAYTSPPLLRMAHKGKPSNNK